MAILMSDVVDSQTAIAADYSVAESADKRHARGHSLTNPSDHSDVSGTPAAGDVMGYPSSGWAPVELVADGGTY